MRYEWLVLTVTSIGTLMGGIDSRIIVVGLPTVAQQLHADPEQLVWVTQSYVLADTVCLLLVGRIGDLYGRVKMYNLGFMVFTIGSALSAFSADPFQLIGFRVFQGVGAAMIFTNSAAIIADASPTKSLGLMLGINQMTLRGGSMLGLTLSGLILSLVDWRGLFYVNIPIGIFGTIWAYKRLHEISTKQIEKKLDWPGFASFTVALSLILLGITFLGYGLSETSEAYSFLIIGFVLMGVFVRIESRAKSPLLDLRLFKIKIFALANIAQFLNSVTWTGLVLLLAFYLQIGLGYNALLAGVAIIPVDLVYLVTTLFSSKLSDKYGSRMLSTTGLVVNVIGFLALTAFSVSSSYLTIVIALVIFGLGNGLFNTPNTREIMSSVPPDRRGIASGLRSMMFNLGLTVSYGLVVVLITIGIPYGIFTQLLEGTAASPLVIAAARMEFVNGFRIAAFVLALITAAAIIPSWMRGPRVKPTLSPA
ncbi:MAG: MFS transporter [Nitrososphaerales archaeon]